MPSLRLTLVLSGLLSLGLPSPSVAQAGSPVGRDRAGATVGLETRLTSIGSRRSLMLGGHLRFHLEGPFSFGVEGWTLADDAALSPDDPGGGFGIALSYAGGAGHVVLGRHSRGSVGLGLLAGAGNSKVRALVSRTEVGADNFLVLEPSLGTSLRLVGPLDAHGALSYRWVAGVEDLTGLTPDQLRGLSFSLGLSFGPF